GDGPPDPAPYQNKRVVYLDSGSADFSWAEATMYPSNLMIDDDGWSGWDGPYLEKLSAKTPWGGTYFFYRWDGFTNPIWRDYIFIIVHDVCYPPDERRYECELPGNSAQRIDDMIDDGNTTWESGLFSFYEPAADPEEDAYIWGLADVE
ncbi:MAG: hypothetical protein KKH25_02855, partial [Candidatus Omnitrophica bacterium]|nr:hypothetical protein [Candidatus Omnitrophota bacterium]